jgi:glycogen debranching enzyme
MPSGAALIAGLVTMRYCFEQAGRQAGSSITIGRAEMSCVYIHTMLDTGGRQGTWMDAHACIWDMARSIDDMEAADYGRWSVHENTQHANS